MFEIYDGVEFREPSLTRKSIHAGSRFMLSKSIARITSIGLIGNLVKYMSLPSFERRYHSKRLRKDIHPTSTSISIAIHKE